MLKTSGVYTQAPGSNALALRACGLTQPVYDDLTAPKPGGCAFYLVTTVVNGVEGSLGTDSHGVPRLNAAPCP